MFQGQFGDDAFLGVRRALSGVGGRQVAYSLPGQRDAPSV